MNLQWGHGDEAVEEPIHGSGSVVNCPSFNGATAMKPWKSLVGFEGVHRIVRLQWGHGDEAVEELESPWQPLAAVTASMGPRR